MLKCFCFVLFFLLLFFPAIKEKYTDWTEFLIRDLTGSRTAPANLLEGVCIAIIHLCYFWSIQLCENRLNSTLHISFCRYMHMHSYLCKESNFLFCPGLFRWLIQMALVYLLLRYQQKMENLLWVHFPSNNLLGSLPRVPKVEPFSGVSEYT